MNDIVKILEIIFVLSPLFLTGIASGLLLSRGITILQTYTFYWLVVAIIFSVLYITAFIDKESSFSTVMMLGAFASSAYTIFLTKTKKKNKKSR